MSAYFWVDADQNGDLWLMRDAVVVAQIIPYQDSEILDAHDLAKGICSDANRMEWQERIAEDRLNRKFREGEGMRIDPFDGTVEFKAGAHRSWRLAVDLAMCEEKYATR